MASEPSECLLKAARRLRAEVSRLKFGPSVALVYNPLDYAWAPYELYIKRFGSSPKRVIFLGMNPGPFGMVQTGIPFGAVPAVRDWLQIKALINRPAREHPARPVLGFECPRTEVSGQRLWGLFAKRFESPTAFFGKHFVLNYCPLAFLGPTGANHTPDKLPASEKALLFASCDKHLKQAVVALQPSWVIGIGDFAFERARTVVTAKGPAVARILHPSPASPAANRDWAGTATKQLQDLGVWSA